MLCLQAEYLLLRTRHPFIIARGGQSDYKTVWVRLTDGDGHEGWGEAAPTKFYGETPETVMEVLQTYAQHLPADPFDLEETERRLETALRGNPSARAALSAAMHDLVGKRLGVPVYKLWGLDPARAPMSTFTIGIDTPERIRMKVHAAHVGIARDAHQCLCDSRQSERIERLQADARLDLHARIFAYAEL